MDKSIKNDVLEMLKQFMMGEHGKKLKPSAVTVEVITPVKKGEKGDLDEVLEKAGKRMPMSEEEGDVDGDGDHDLHDHALEKEAEMYEDVAEGEVPDDEDEDEKKFCKGGMAKKSLRDFFDR